jgi:ABC-type nitrate/sulfonate/bicarbonate transport system substrate-binding protein
MMYDPAAPMPPRSILACAALCLSIGAASCARSNPGRESPPAITIGYSGEIDFGDLPSLIAQARLRAHGYRVTVVHLGAPDLAIDAVARGSVDVVHGSMVGAWRAAARGARVRTVMDHVANPFRLVVSAGISSCEGLDGRRLATSGEGAVSTHLMRAFVREQCPAALPVELALTESTSRASALLAGGIDATPLELSALMWLEKQAPNRFHVLSDFAARWPLVRTTGVHVNMDYAAAHADAVREYVRELVAANREALADPGVLVPAAMKALGSGDDWAAVGRAYRDAAMWPENGGLTQEDVAATLSFFKQGGILPSDITSDAVVDLRFLEQALADGGR